MRIVLHEVLSLCDPMARTNESLTLGAPTWMLCAVPLLLASGVIVTHVSWRARPQLTLRRRAQATDEDERAELFTEIQEEWDLHQGRVHAATLPIALLTLLHGALASLLLLIPVCLLRQLLRTCSEEGSFLSQIYNGLMTNLLVPWSVLELSAFAVVAAVGLHSAMAFGRLFRRAARHDLTPLALAEALRGLLASVLLTVAIVSLMLRDISWLTPEHALLVGGLMSLLGPGLMDLIYQGTSILFGLYSTSEDGLVDCTEVDGLDDVDRQRLQEIGVDSLHSLAYASVALLFLSSRYTYERICDWKDQALLEILVGKHLKRRLSEEMGIRGATSLLDALERDPSAMKLDARNTALADCVRHDRSVRVLQAWKACSPALTSTPAPRAPSP